MRGSIVVTIFTRCRSCLCTRRFVVVMKIITQSRTYLSVREVGRVLVIARNEVSSGWRS